MLSIRTTGTALAIVLIAASACSPAGEQNTSGDAGRLGFDPAGDTTNREISIFEAPEPDPKAAWQLAGTVDYSAHLPY